MEWILRMAADNINGITDVMDFKDGRGILIGITDERI